MYFFLFTKNDRHFEMFLWSAEVMAHYHVKADRFARVWNPRPCSEREERCVTERGVRTGLIFSVISSSRIIKVMGSCQGQSRGYQPKADTPTATLIVLVITKNLIQTYNCFIIQGPHWTTTTKWRSSGAQLIKSYHVFAAQSAGTLHDYSKKSCMRRGHTWHDYP